MQEVQKLPDSEKNQITSVIDALIRDFKRNRRINKQGHSSSRFHFLLLLLRLDSHTINYKARNCELCSYYFRLLLHFALIPYKELLFLTKS